MKQGLMQNNQCGQDLIETIRSGMPCCNNMLLGFQPTDAPDKPLVSEISVIRSGCDPLLAVGMILVGDPQNGRCKTSSKITTKLTFH